VSSFDPPDEHEHCGVCPGCQAHECECQCQDEPTIVHTCTMCGATITREQWAAMRLNGPLDDGGDLLELRTHECGSTLAIVVGPSPRFCTDGARLEPWSLADFRESNSEDPDVDSMLRQLGALGVGASVTFGGGAVATSTITRLS
jgi:hypothetical protein